MLNEDNQSYYRFTGPQRLDRAVHSLEGLLKGIAADHSAHQREMAILHEWLAANKEFRRFHPFNEIMPRLEDALSDGVFDAEEMADVLWLCSRMTTDNTYFDDISSDMQRLHGILGGIAADGTIAMEELDALVKWMEDHEHLRMCWPFDEIESLLLAVRADKRIDPAEHDLLLSFFSEFTSLGEHRSLGLPLNEVNVPITGLCAVCPEVQFPGRLFCFTGSSQKATRKELAHLVEMHGGEFSKTLTRGVDYLVIGADGNPCWAYACYGRKVEQAIQHRKKGSHMLLVHEYDFWDAIQEER